LFKQLSLEGASDQKKTESSCGNWIRNDKKVTVEFKELKPKFAEYWKATHLDLNILYILSQNIYY
jgi:hypothetical protein